MIPKLFLDYLFIGDQSICQIIWGDARFNNSHFIFQKWFEMRHFVCYEYLKYSKHLWPSPQPSWKPPRNFSIMHDIHHSIARHSNYKFACGTLFLSNFYRLLKFKILLGASFKFSSWNQCLKDELISRKLLNRLPITEFTIVNSNISKP